MKEKNNIRRGQIFSSDLILAVVVFFILMIVVSHMWGDSTKRADTWVKREIMQRKAYQASSFLILSPGYPFSWDSNDVKVLGLTMGEQNVIGINKFNELQSMTESDIKELLNVEEYNLYIVLSYHGGSTIGFVGTAPSANATEIISIDSYVVYNNGLAVLDLRLWV
jgi:hypothetical protein